MTSFSSSPKKLHIGCGNVYLKGWMNIDVEGEHVDLHHDVRKSLPFEENSVDFIYHEHFIEHLTVHEGLDFLKECRRVLKPHAVMRIATADLNYTVFRYFFFWKWQSWIKQYGYEWVQTRAELLNIGFREWGHQYLYNREELVRRLGEVGFTNIQKVRWGKSAHEALKKLETRKESDLICEVQK